MKYTVNFYLRGGDKNRSTKPIYLFIHINGERFKLSTGERIKEQDWNARKQMVKNKNPQAKYINPKLFDLRSKVETILIEQEVDWSKVSGNYFRQHLNTTQVEEPEMEKPNLGLLYLYDRFLDDILIEVKAGKITMGYLKNLKALRMHLVNLTKRKRYLRMELPDMAPVFAEDLKLYFAKNSFKTNTIDKHFRSLKRFLKWAKIRGYTGSTLDLSHPSFKTKKEQVDYPALNEEELQRLKDLPLAQNPRLERVRDQFIFLCEQGLRFSDLQSLKTKDVKTDTDELGEEISYMEYYTQKTKEHVIAPLSIIGEELIDTYYKASNKQVFPTISNQKFNIYLKELAQLAEIEKDISSHTGRRTFITLCIERGMDLESIMIHTGHRSMDELLRYWKKSKAHRLKKGRLLIK